MAAWIITISTVLIVYYLDRWENRYIQSVFDWVPAILLAYLIPALVSMVVDLDLAQDGIHQYSKDYFIPLAIVAVMSSLSMAQLKLIGWKPILLFVSGSCWIALFPVILVFVFFDHALVQELMIEGFYWQGIPPIVGSWIGGSTSQLVLKEAVDCPETIFLSVLVMDNILVNVWTVMMFQGIKKSAWFNRILGIDDLSMPEDITMRDDRAKLHVLISFAILLGLVLLVNVFMVSFITKVIVLSLIGLLVSHLIPIWNYQFSLQLGSILILVVMAVLGLKLTFDGMTFELGFFYFLIFWLVSHFFIMLLVAKLLNLNAAWVPIASMANVGGIATAPAVTAAYNKEWMPHAIILAILSMATGTVWGLLTIYLLQAIIS